MFTRRVGRVAAASVWERWGKLEIPRQPITKAEVNARDSLCLCEWRGNSTDRVKLFFDEIIAKLLHSLTPVYPEADFEVQAATRRLVAAPSAGVGLAVKPRNAALRPTLTG